jgi:hypothetical protein
MIYSYPELSAGGSMSTSEAGRQWKDQLVELTTTEFVLSVSDDGPPTDPEPPSERLLVDDVSAWLRKQRSNLLYASLRKDLNMSAKQAKSRVSDLQKTRVQLDMSPNELQRLNWVMEVCDLGTRKELFNVALTLLEWAVKETNDGRRIASFDDRTNDRLILSMPALSAASRHAQRYVSPEIGIREEQKSPELRLKNDYRSEVGGPVAASLGSTTAI